MRSVSNLLRVVPLAALLLPIACIERSNPFDPVNLRPTTIQQTRDRQKPVLDSLLSAGAITAARLADYLVAFQEDSAANGVKARSNRARRAGNDSTSQANAATAAANAGQTDADLLGLQVLLVELETLAAYGPYGRLDAEFDSLKALALSATRLMEKANSDAAPVVVYPPDYRNQVLAPLARDSTTFAILQGAIAAGNAAVVAGNDSIRDYNDSVRLANAAVRDFNGQVAFLQQAKRNGIVLRADSLAILGKNAKPGDTLLLGPAEFRVDLRMASGTEEKPILVRGYPGRKSVLLPEINAEGPIEEAVILNRSAHIIFEDLVFRGGAVNGVKLSSGSRSVTFRRCLFEGNQVRGIEASGSDLLLFDCEIRGNGNDSAANSGGIRVEMASDSGRIQFENVLVVANRGAGIEAVSPQGSLSHVTLAYNTKDGLRLLTNERSLQVTHSILAFNGGYGLWRNPSQVNPYGLNVESCDLWGNFPEDWYLRTLSAERQAELRAANFSVDPAFRDPATFDYRPKPGSDLANLESQPLPVVVGYRPKP